MGPLYTTEDDIRIRLLRGQELRDEVRIRPRVHGDASKEILGPIRDTLVWSANIGQAPANATMPVVAAGVIYYGGRDRLRAFDAQTGQQRWEYVTAERVWSTPAVEAGRVYVESDGGNIYALDATTGKLIWHTTVHDDTMRGQPRVADGIVYADDGNDTLYALDANYGTLLWQFAYHSGTLLWQQLNDKNIVCACTSVTKQIVTLNALTGNVVLTDTYQFGRTYWDVVHDGITFQTDDNTLYAIDSATQGLRWTVTTTGVIRPTDHMLDSMMYTGSADGNVYALDLGTGRERWRFSPSASIAFQPVVGNEMVYVVSNGRFDEILAGTPTVNDARYKLHGDQAVYALDRHTGHVLWQSAISDGVVGQPVLAGTMLYFGTTDGKLQAFRVQ